MSKLNIEDIKSKAYKVEELENNRRFKVTEITHQGNRWWNIYFKKKKINKMIRLDIRLEDRIITDESNNDEH